MTAINMIMDLEIFEDTFQSSTPVERKCENANIISHIILTSHGAKVSQGWDPLVYNKINPGLQKAFHHPCIFWCTSLKRVTEERGLQASGTKISRK